jgi:DNA-binding NtrC family response regulator
MSGSQTLSILVVEDGQSQREVMRDFLREKGHDVSEAEQGEEALDLLGRNYVDLLLIDYKMPGMDGMELLERVKRVNPEIDVIMMTAYGTVETAVQAMKAGAADYITKPIELD